MILRNYRNKILSWDISDDLIYNESVKEWVEKLDANKPEVSKSPIILNEDNHYFNPYYNLLKNIIVIGNSIDKHITINYQQTINPSSFNYENDIQKLSIVYQMVHRLLEEMVPMNSLQFKFSFNLSSSSNEKEKEEEKEIISDSVFHFISNLKIFSNLKTNIDFLIPNNEKVRAIEFDRFIQICHKNSIKCQFSLVESIKNYKSIVSFNFYNNDYNSNMSSYFNSTLDIINSKIYKRDNFDSRSYNITFSMNDSEDSKVYEYNYDLYKLEDFPEFTYNDLYEYKKITIKKPDEIIESSKNVTSLSFYVVVDINDNGDRKANYLFNAIALYINNKKEIDPGRDIEIVVSVKDSRNSKDEMCIESDSNKYDPTCPDLALLTSNDISVYFKKVKLTSLDKFIREYYKDYGITLESKIYKYAFYDYHIDNQWMAIPFTVQIRTLLFNSTTFENCKLFNKDLELHLPPPYHEYWDSSTDETSWDWKSFFEYAKVITDCTKYPGITFFGENYEELKFLSMFIQSVGIPFIIENDDKAKVKMFATENKIDFADRFEILEEALKNGSINEWIKKESIDKWRKNPYPSTFKEIENTIFEKISNEDVLKLYSNSPSIIGMAIANPEKMIKYFDNENSEIKYGYVPGISSYYGGEGFVITNSKKKNSFDLITKDAFDLITLFINNTLPFLHDANTYITPFEDTENSNCKQTSENLSECNNYIDNAISTVYYFIDKSNNYVIINAEHVKSTSTSNAKLIIRDKEFLTTYYSQSSPIEFICGMDPNFEKKEITYYNNRIDLPILNNNINTVLTIKSTNDYFSSNSNNDVSLCTIANEMLKIARPIQYPLNGFEKMSEIENKELVARLFVNIRYKHSEDRNPTLTENLEEFKRLVDHYILPNCKENNFETNFTLSACKESTITQDVNYINCIPSEESDTTTRCNYIPYSNIISILSFVVIGISFVSGLVSLFLMIKHRKSKNISAFGMDFSIILLFSTFILTISIIFWLGEGSTVKCNLRIWFQIIGLTNIVGSILLKEERISSIFIGKDVQKIFAPKMKDIYIKLGVFNIIQIILLLLWTLNVFEKEPAFRQDIEYHPNLGYKDIEYCDIFNSKFVAVMFLFIFCMIIYTLLISIKIRNIPKEFNESRFIISSSTFQIIMIFFVFFVCIITKTEVYRSLCFIICMLLLIIFTRPLFIEYKIYCIITKKNTDSSIVIVNASSYISSSEKKTDYQTSEFKSTNGAVTEVHSIF
ncbi:hypothetical protein H8356DRAFT_950382 [Neocallimastix lanati (nom. inval.)]|uniref:G-protein coupled receptors family 3 profile domain-containing protein n=1 Tax=Neocallimastix californiae TaxID=1754190 RepID=A0A1Y2BI88_9FUNG|nr:hypothetical protein H8356DRAFT_950382 [Neocallimastix sp. JGI-2020a]ORY34503.1 hypothetical protein LY90DRAFT_673218 [Neocallimastix californiae]|eukprot:ORY34503.1 hypothetical protein LY90DRAFT_673218 [Neocallimastix californiae]